MFHITPFFELSLALLTTHAIGLYEVTKNFSVIDSKFTLGKDLCVRPYLQGKNGKNKPENPQNWNMAKIAPKSDKFTK